MDWWPLTSRCCIIHQFFSLTEEKKKETDKVSFHILDTFGQVWKLSGVYDSLVVPILFGSIMIWEKTFGTCFYWAGFFFVYYTPLESS